MLLPRPLVEPHVAATVSQSRRSCGALLGGAGTRHKHFLAQTPHSSPLAHGALRY